MNASWELAAFPAQMLPQSSPDNPDSASILHREETPLLLAFCHCSGVFENIPLWCVSLCIVLRVTAISKHLY